MMDLIRLTLGFSFENLAYEDIVKYFEQERDETNNLEFKAYNPDDELSKNISKLYETICAFLNSEGGVIIWGSPRTKKEGDRKFCKGELFPINISIDKDDIARKIISNISILPSGIRIKQLTEGNNTLLIFEVQRSEHRPHQIVKTGTYYMRVDANNIPAPHHFVEALIKRIRYPELHGVLEFKSFVVHRIGDINFVGQVPPQKTRIAYRINVDVVIENLSPIQNEEFPWFLFSCDNGKPLKASEDWPPNQYSLINLKGTQPNAQMEILHYGQKFIRHRAIGLYYDDLYSEGFIVNVLLKYGGRFSPLKYSLYSLDLSFLSGAKLEYKKAFEIPLGQIKAQENILMADADFSIEDSDQWEAIEYF